MASSSKQLPEETAEDIEARKRMVMSGNQAGNLMAYEPGTEIMMNRDGSNGFSMGGDLSDQFKWNEKTGDYRSHGGGIMSIAEMPQVQSAAPVGAPPPKKKKPDWRDDIDYDRPEGSAGSGPGLTTDQIVDNSGMQNWMDMGPQTSGQNVNALVDPENWQYQVNPEHQQVRNLGRYKNPMLDDWMNDRKKQGLLSRQTGGLI